jgi:hypothetical protein
MEHVLRTPETCDCDRYGDRLCPVCDHGLAICAICGRAENELDGPCPGTPASRFV